MLAWSNLGHLWWWEEFLHPGKLSPHGGYWFYSGIAGGCILFAAGYGLFRKANCSAPWCPRIGLHPTADGQHHLCGHHHPDHPTTVRVGWLPHWLPFNVPRTTLAEIHARHERHKTKAA